MLCHYIRTDVLLGNSSGRLFLKNSLPVNIQQATSISPTEREYDLAATLHKSRLIYIKSVGEEKRCPKDERNCFNTKS